MWSTASQATAPHDPTNRSAKPFPGHGLAHRQPMTKKQPSTRGRVRQSPHLAAPNPSSAEEWRSPVVPRGSDDPRIVASHDTLLRIEHLEAATASSSAQSAKLAKVLSDTVLQTPESEP